MRERVTTPVRTNPGDGLVTPGVLTEDMMEAVRRFLPHEALALLGRNCITDAKLGDQVERTMTILFSDIRDFTPLTEDMTPEDSFAFINGYFRLMEPVITRNNGIIDKYMGDAVMVVFPESADDALQCAIEMLETLPAYNTGRERADYRAIRIGIGLNTGLMMLGIVGGTHHMESTVISDAVNLAARLESLTKDYRTPILISEQTYYHARHISDHDTRFIDRVKVKGKAQPQSVYEVFDADPPALREGKRETRYLFEEALAHYHMKDVLTALNLLSECLRRAPDDTVAQVYRLRCERFLETGIHESSGEFDLTIAWDPSVEIGHPEIDAQHHGLFDFTGRFVEAMKKERDLSHIDEITGFIDRYVAEHFACEEGIMAEAHYPFLKAQTVQHQRFVHDFGAYKEELGSNLATRRPFLLFRAQILLIDWLVSHTSKADRHFGRYLKRMKSEGGTQ